MGEHKVILLTGGNLGNVPDTLARALREVARRVGPVVQSSSVRISDPWGFEARDRFYNQVLVLRTELTPEEVLDRAQEIETLCGRVREKGDDWRSPRRTYRSRTLDIDLLFYDDAVIDSPRLAVPHPRLHERAFVLEPLAEILPDLVHPVLKKTVLQLRDGLRRQTELNEPKTIR